MQGFRPVIFQSIIALLPFQIQQPLPPPGSQLPFQLLHEECRFPVALVPVPAPVLRSAVVGFKPQRQIGTAKAMPVVHICGTFDQVRSHEAAAVHLITHDAVPVDNPDVAAEPSVCLFSPILFILLYFFFHCPKLVALLLLQFLSALPMNFILELVVIL